MKNKTIEKMYDMTKEEDVKKFAVYLQENEKTVVNLLVQHFINNTKNEDISMKLKQMFPKISPNTDSFVFGEIFGNICFSFMLMSSFFVLFMKFCTNKFITVFSFSCRYT